MKQLCFCLAFGLLGVAVVGCGDDGGPGGGGGSSTSASTNAASSTSASTSATTSSSTASTSSSASSSTTSTGSSSSSGGMGFGCVQDPSCSLGQLECACSGDCTLCNEMECFTWDFAVQCVDGFAGVTCVCMVDGQMVGNCNEAQLSCELEASCCVQFLQT